MENVPEKENTFPALYAGTAPLPGGTARRVVFAAWSALEPAEGCPDAAAADAVREALIRSVARGEQPVLCLYAGEDPAWFAEKGGWLIEDNLRCFLRYAGRAARGLVQQRAQANTARMTGRKHFEQEGQRHAGIENILDDYEVSALNVAVEILDYLNHARGFNSRAIA